MCCLNSWSLTVLCNCRTNAPAASVSIHLQTQTNVGASRLMYTFPHRLAQTNPGGEWKSDQMRGCLLSCGSSPGRRALALPAHRVFCCSCRRSWGSLVMKMMCSGPHPVVSIKMWAERLRVCVWGCVYLCAVCACKCLRASTQWAALLKNNDLNQVQVLWTTWVFAAKPLQLVFIVELL